ncbi:MAG TPA: hypothetical protein VGC70_04300, partial [Burkholderiales bacterium]
SARLWSEENRNLPFCSWHARGTPTENVLRSDHPPRLVSCRRSIAVTDLYRNCLLPLVIQMTEDDLQRVLESIGKLKRSGAMEADELAHIERVTEQWIEFFRNSLNKAPG